MVADPAISDRDRKALDAIVHGDPDLGIDPADFPAWAQRPEIQPALKVAWWFAERRARLDTHRAIEAAMDHLRTALDQRPDVKTTAQFAETRRAATALAELAFSCLYGPPRRRPGSSDEGRAPIVGNPPSLLELARSLSADDPAESQSPAHAHAPPDPTPADPAPARDPTRSNGAPSPNGNPAANSSLRLSISSSLPPTQPSSAPSTPRDPDTASPSPTSFLSQPGSLSTLSAISAVNSPPPLDRSAPSARATPSIPSSPTPVFLSSLSALSAISAVKSPPLRLAARAGTTDTS